RSCTPSAATRSSASSPSRGPPTPGSRGERDARGPAALCPGFRRLHPGLYSSRTLWLALKSKAPGGVFGTRGRSRLGVRWGAPAMRRLTACLLVALAASPAAAAETTLERIKREGVLRWGADPSGGAPFVFTDPKAPDRVIGFEVDLAGRLAR